jgi:Chaperonin 10 Kd subunit
LGRAAAIGKLIPIDIKAGDRVLFGKWSSTEVKIDGQELLIMKESDIMGIMDEPAAKKKAAPRNLTAPPKRSFVCDLKAVKPRDSVPSEQLCRRSGGRRVLPLPCRRHQPLPLKH